MRDFFVENLDVVYFFYGLGFVVLGLIIFIQLRASEESRFRLLSILGLLGWFGLLHGASEWSDMFLIIKGESVYLGFLDSALVFVSYGLVFAFGYRLIYISGYTGLAPWLPFVLGAAFVAVPLYHGPGTFLPWTVSARYFFGFGGAVLSAIGLPLYYREQLRGLAEADRLRRYFFSAAFFFGVYGLVAGLVPPPADFFPANIVNSASFLAVFGFPAPVIRAVAAVVIAWSMWNVIDIFNLEKAAERRQVNTALRVEKDKAQQYFQIAGVMLLVIGTDGKVQLINKRGAEILGCPESEIIGRDWFDNFLPAEVRPEVRSVFKQAVSGDVEMIAQHENPILNCAGEQRLISWHNAVLTDEAGNIIGGLSSGEDITERRQAEDAVRRARDELERRVEERTAELANSNDLLRQEAAVRERNEQLSSSLNGINAAINSTLDFDRIMNRVAVEATRALGCDAAAIMLREDGRWIIRYLYGLPRVRAGRHVSADEDRCLHIAATTGETAVFRDVIKEGALAPAMAEEFGTKSCLATPLKAKGEVIGIINFSHTAAPVGFSEPEVDFASKLASAVSLALENSRLYETERHIADTLQEALLTVPETIPGTRFGHLFRSGTEVARVGGDFYDLFEVGQGRIGLVIGDVSGKGVEAATLTALVRNTVKAYSYEQAAPAEIMAKTNQVVVKTPTGSMFATLFLAFLDQKTGSLTYCSAGHPPPIIKRRGGGVSVLDTASPAVGVMPDFQYADRKEALAKGDTLLLYTDGLIEARYNDGFFGEERLVQFIEEVPDLPADRLPSALFDELLRLGCRLTDDLAIVALSLE
jgi:PAS domain S-box-containing protein